MAPCYKEMYKRAEIRLTNWWESTHNVARRQMDNAQSNGPAFPISPGATAFALTTCVRSCVCVRRMCECALFFIVMLTRTKRAFREVSNRKGSHTGN